MDNEQSYKVSLICDYHKLKKQADEVCQVYGDTLGSLANSGLPLAISLRANMSDIIAKLMNIEE